MKIGHKLQHLLNHHKHSPDAAHSTKVNKRSTHQKSSSELSQNSLNLHQHIGNQSDKSQFEANKMNLSNKSFSKLESADNPNSEKTTPKRTNLSNLAGKIRNAAKNLRYSIKNKTSGLNANSRALMQQTLDPKTVLKNMAEKFNSQGWSEDLEQALQFIQGLNKFDDPKLLNQAKTVIEKIYSSTEDVKLKDSAVSQMRSICGNLFYPEGRLSVILNAEKSFIEKKVLMETLVDSIMDSSNPSEESPKTILSKICLGSTDDLREDFFAVIANRIENALDPTIKQELIEFVIGIRDGDGQLNKSTFPLPKALQDVLEKNLNPTEKAEVKTPLPEETPKKEPTPLTDGEKTNLKKDFIRFLCNRHYSPGNVTISERISQANDPDLMNIPKLIAELPSIFPFTMEDAIESYRNGLMKAWISLEAGHEWGIKLDVTVGNEKNITTGGTLSLTNAKAAMLVSNFMQSEDAKLSLSPQSREKVIQAALSGAKAAQNTAKNFFSSAHGLSDSDANHSTGKMLMDDLNTNGIITIPTGWSQHAVGITIHKAKDGKCFLYYCNRGGQAFERTEDRAMMGKDNPATNMVCFEIKNIAALNEQLLGDIAKAGMYSTDPMLVDQFAKPFIEGKNGIFAILGLEEREQIIKSPQKVGNCTWANCKGALHAAMIAAAYDEGKSDMQSNIAMSEMMFKKMERFGRKQGLEPLLKYNAQDTKSSINPFDHLRVLSAAGRKLEKKAAEMMNLSDTRSEDTQMRDRVLNHFNHCSYPIDSFKHHSTLNPSSEKLEEALKNAGNGAYSFVNNQCWVCKDGKIEKHENIETDRSLGNFLNDWSEQGHIPSLTLPVFLNDRNLDSTA